jgi:hypothetical protein
MCRVYSVPSWRTFNFYKTSFPCTTPTWKRIKNTVFLIKNTVFPLFCIPMILNNLNMKIRLTFKPQKYFLLIFNVGDGQGIFWKKDWAWESRLGFLLKDYIDRKFMRKFQVSGELDERFDSME